MRNAMPVVEKGKNLRNKKLAISVSSQNEYTKKKTKKKKVSQVRMNRLY